MHELEEAERYAIAALFTLALHSAASQADNGGEGWGEPEDEDQYVEPTPDEPDPFWGRDLVLPGGLLDALYFQLGLPPFKWPGLKALPSVAPTSDSAAFRSAVRSLIAVLDEELAASLPAPSAQRKIKESPRADSINVPDELWDGILGSSDEDDQELEKDRQWERHLEEQQRLREQQHRSALLLDEEEVWNTVESPLSREAKQTLKELSSPQGRLRPPSRQQSEEYSALVKQLEEMSAEDKQLSVKTKKEENAPVSPFAASSKTLSPEQDEGKEEEEEKKELRKSSSKRSTTTQQQHRDVSPIAVAALWELLQCCIGANVAAAEAAKAATEEESGKLSPQSPKFLRRQGPPPCIRFYDARARVALGLVSLWLQVPQRKLATLEVLLGSDKAPTTVRQRGDGSSASADRYRYLKVGLAAVGGGALFAVTGGLAAPAIAAGVGSILGIVPGAGAAAGAVAGFMSTQVGVAAVTTTMATAGAATTGSKMAYRTADVKEFGFLEVREHMAPAALASNISTGTGSRSPTKTAPPPASEGADPGHLSMSSLGQRTPSSSSVRSISSSSLSDVNSTAAPEQSSNSTPSWKSWFGSKKNMDSTTTNNKEEEKEKLENQILPSPLRQSHPAEGIKLSTIIGVSGWIASPEDFFTPWTTLSAPAADKFALVWCTSELQTLNSALGALLAKGAAGQATRLGLQHLLVGGAGLVTALGPTVILGAAAGLLIENAWTVAIDRSDKAGKLLAHVLMSGGTGGRPVTLIAHSMGARLVFSALLELCRCGARGLVQDVVLLGAPVPPAVERWKMARRVVAGRLVNGYSRNDWLLSVMFWQGIAKPAAGLAPVEVDGIENISLSSLVRGHFDYIGNLTEIIDLLQMQVFGNS